LTACVIVVPTIALTLARLNWTASPQSRHLIFALPFFSTLLAAALVAFGRLRPPLTALVAAAAEGIRRDSTPPPPVEGDASEREDLPSLPGSLESALAAFAADPEFRALLGATFCDYYATSRAWELKAWRESVSDWERERYERAV
jgi:hypothetical protein